MCLNVESPSLNHKKPSQGHIFILFDPYISSLIKKYKIIYKKLLH